MNFLFRTFTQPSLLSFRSRFFFSMSKQQTIEMHQAILASKIIYMISTQSATKINNQIAGQLLTQNILYPSLRSRVISAVKQYNPKDKREHQKNHKDYDKEPQFEIAKKNMLKFFDGGVWVDSNLCIQERFFSQASSSQPSIQLNLKGESPNKNELNGPKQEQKVLGKKKLTFCPTYLITGRIFRAILSEYQYLFIVGHFGIGKTYSFMLYHLLSNCIYKYLHKYCKDSSQVPEGINRLFPKLVYWSIDIDQFKKKNGIEVINKIIADQCYELTQGQPDHHYFKQTENKYDLQSFYLQKGISLRLIIDQIHTIASAYRTFDNFVSISKQLQGKNDYLKAKQEAEKDPSKKYLVDQLDNKNIEIQTKIFRLSNKKIYERFTLANQLLEMVETLRNKFGRAFFLSSRTIEKSQMRYLNLNGQQRHNNIQRYHLQFNDFSLYPQNLADLGEFFVLLLKIKYKELYKSDDFEEKYKNVLPKIKVIVFNCLNKQNLMIIPYTMRIVILGVPTMQGQSEQQDNFGCEPLIRQILNQENTQEKLKQLIKQMIDIINNRSKAELSELIDNFMKKSERKQFQQVSKNKKMLLLKLFYAVKSKILRNKSDSNLRKTNVVIDASQIFSSKVSKQQIEESLDKNIAYYFDDNKFYLTVNQSIALEVFEEKQKKLLEALLQSDAKIYSLIDSQVSKGLYIESLIRHCLQQQNTQLILRMQKNKKSKEDLTFYKMAKMDKMQRLYFQSLPLKNSKNYNNYSFLSNFDQKMQSMSYGFYLFMPTRQKFDYTAQGSTNDKQIQVDEKSKKIDFVLTEYTDSNFYITAFDVTIDKSKALEKITHFFYEFSNFNDKQQQKIGNQQLKNVELRYVVFLPQKTQIQWKTLLDKAISWLNQDLSLEQKKQKESKSPSLDKTERLNKRIQFLKKLSEDKNLIQHESSLKIKRSRKLKTLLTRVSVFSFFDAQIKNQDQGKISLYKRLLKQAQIEHYYNKNSQK